MKWGHNDLADDLARHLRGSTDRVIWTDMQLGPSGSPRPDVYSIPKSYAKFVPVAYEVKISVADFRSDATSGKWQKYLKYSAGVVFAVPKGLITKADVPKTCGLMTRNDDGWVTVKAPTLQRCETLPHEAWMKLVIDGIERARRLDPEARSLNTWFTKDKIRARYGEELAAALSRRDDAIATLASTERHHREEIDRRNKAHAERMKRLAEEQASESRYVDRSRDELCRALGLPEGTGAFEIASALDRVRKVLSADSEVGRMRKQIESMRRTLDHAVRDFNKESPLEKITADGDDA